MKLDLLPTITLLIGIIGTLAVTWLQGVLAESSRQSKRDRVRRTALEDRRDAFELETLQAAFDASNLLARASFRQHLLDIRVARSANVPYGSHQLTGIEGAAELGESLRLANMTTHARASLLLDTAIRDALEEAVGAMNAVGTTGAKSIEEAKSEMDKASLVLAAAQRSIADRIREIYLNIGT